MLLVFVLHSCLIIFNTIFIATLSLFKWCSFEVSWYSWKLKKYDLFVFLRNEGIFVATLDVKGEWVGDSDSNVILTLSMVTWVWMSPLKQGETVHPCKNAEWEFCHYMQYFCLAGIFKNYMSADLLSKAQAIHPFKFCCLYKIVKKEDFHMHLKSYGSQQVF